MTVARGARGRRGVRVVFEDDDLIVVEKPAGLLTISTATEKARTLYALLRAHVRSRAARARIFIVHRLDREASGLLVFAKNPDAKRVLQEQFKRREAGRSYLALVEGSPDPGQRMLRSNLAENRAHRVYVTRAPGAGRPAVTHLRVLRGRGRCTLLDVTLETGRKHQIRVQLADAGHPIVGDGRYGSAPRGSQRLALHAARLRFRHPRSGEALEFRSEPDFAADPLWAGARFVPSKRSRSRLALRPPRRNPMLNRLPARGRGRARRRSRSRERGD